MNQNKLSIRFVINKAKMNKRGLCPISCRLTFRLKRKAISTGEFINPLEWNAKKQQASSKTIANQQINLQLEIITANIKKAHLQLQLVDDAFGVEEIFAKYLGKTVKKDEYVISYFEKYLVKQSKLIGKDLKLSTWKKSEYVCHDVEEFIKSNYGIKDYPLNKLDQSFLNDFEYYLKTVKNQKQVTINKGIQRFRKPIKIAVGEGYIQKTHLYCTNQEGSEKRSYSFQQRSCNYSKSTISHSRDFNWSRIYLYSVVIQDWHIMKCPA